MAGRHVDDKPQDLPGCHGFKVLTNRVDVPAIDERTRLDHIPCANRNEVLEGRDAERLIHHQLNYWDRRELVGFEIGEIRVAAGAQPRTFRPYRIRV